MVEASDWDNVDENALGLLKNQKQVMEEYGIDTSQVDAEIEALEGQTAEAESVFGPMMTLQSHFIW